MRAGAAAVIHRRAPAVVAVLLLLATTTVLVNVVLPAWAYPLCGLVVAGALLEVARWSGLRARAIGLDSLLPGLDATAETAAAALGIPAAEAAILIDELVEAGLAQETADARFSLHQTVRRHALACARAEDPEPDRVAMIRRATEHLLVWTAFADRAVLGVGRYRCTPHTELLAAHADPFGGTNSRLRALTWQDAERGNLAAGVRVSVDHGWHELACSLGGWCRRRVAA